MEDEKRYKMIGTIMHTLPVIEGRIGRVMNDRLVRIVDEECDRLTRMQVMALFLLIHREHVTNEPTNMTILSECLHVSAQQATRLVDGLIKNGFAERYQDPANRRMVLVRPTAEGYAYLNQMKQLALPVLDTAFSDINDEQLKRLYECFSAIYEILSEKKKG